MKSTSCRIKKLWIPKLTSLLSLGSPDTLEMDDRFSSSILWFSISISFLSFSAEMSTKKPEVIWTTFKGLCIENGFLVSVLNYSNIKKDLTKDRVMKTSSRLREAFCWTLLRIRSGLQKVFVREIKIYSQCSTVL